jgi:carbon-monoxide dehydrogenase large subunit
MRVVRSTFAHGRLLSVDLEPALAIPGVHAAWCFADVADIPPIGFRLTGLTALEPYRQTILARDRVRYVGDPVAVVFADDPYLAEDAAEHVTVDVEELPVVLHADAPPGEFAEGLSSEPTIIRKEFGDVEAAFRSAYTTVSLSLDIGRHSGVTLETRGAIGRYDAISDMLEMYGAAKVPHWNREQIARMLGRPPLPLISLGGCIRLPADRRVGAAPPARAAMSRMVSTP